MNKRDKIFGYGVFGFIIFMMCFCMGWWLFEILDINVLIGALIGIIIGVTLDILLLKKIVMDLYNLNAVFLVLIYVAYSVGIFGFFMGVPVFNIFLGPLAGYYIGRKMKAKRKGKEIFEKELQKTNIFGLLILLIICISSAVLALYDPYTGANLKGMLGLPFEVTVPIIWGIIITGGITLLISQYFMTKVTAYEAYRGH